MAVAVRNTPDNATLSPGSNLATASIIGAIYVAFAIAAVVVGVPYLWSTGVSSWVTAHLGSFVNVAGLLLVEVVVIGLLFMLGLSLLGGGAKAGVKAGSFTVFAGVIGAILVAALFKSMFAGVAGDIAGTIAGIVALAALSRLVVGANFADQMKAFEAQGWFSAATYKPNQGRRVRRGTLLGVFVLVAAGIYSLLSHHTLDGVGNWEVRLPFAPKSLILLPDVWLTGPLVLIAVSAWLGYRLVHVPTFAEFLIATEGELNKVAWPTRKGLVQDTIVVLATVVLFTVFLFVVDVAWGKILSHPYIGVLRLNSDAKPPEAQEQELDW